MRGKIAVLGMVAITVAVLIFSYWFLFVKSPVDQRFKLNRTDIPKVLNLPILLPETVGDFKRLSFSPVEKQPDGTMSGSATYADTDGKKIVVTVKTGQILKTPTDTLQAFYQPILAKYPGAVPSLHETAEFPYAFFTATVDVSGGNSGYVYSDFTWINGDWIIQSSTQETDAESLLQFVNTYLF